MRLLIVFVALAVLFAIPFALWGEGFERELTTAGARAWLEDHGGWGWAAGIGLLVADLVLPVPATAVISALGLVYGPFTGGLIGSVGSFLAGFFAYGVCRVMGRRAAVWLAGERDLERGERLVARVGPWAVAASRWMPLLPEVIACLAGMVRMRTGVFCLALACGSLPMAFTFAAVGASGSDHPALALTLSAVLPLLLWPLAQRVLAPRGPR